MGLFDKIFGHAPKPVGVYGGVFKMLDGYTPRFTSFNGGIYESELIRAAINARATHISKLKVEFLGSAQPGLKHLLSKGPSEYARWSQFLYRVSTILDCNNNCFLAPTYNRFGDMTGIFCLVPSRCEVVEYGGVPYLRYEFSDGNKASMELNRCGILTKFQYKNDLLGESNAALLPTLDLINIQQQGIKEGVKSAASYKFWGQLSNFAKDEDIAKERRRFSAENFGKDADAGGMLLFPNTYNNIHQAESKPWIAATEEMQSIKDNVYGYFGVNDDVLQNRAFGDAWTAFYEGCVEPFSIQFSEVLTAMLYSPREQASGNAVIATANRLQYMSNSDKLSYSTELLDRGVISINEAREVWNMAPVDDGDQRIIRGEYYKTDEKLGENDDGEE